MGNVVSSPPPVFIDFEAIEAAEAFPRFPDCHEKCVCMHDICREKAVVVFVSHVWVTHKNPDTVDGLKHKLIVEGIRRLWSDYAPRFEKCYLWIDYCCLDQNLRPCAQLQQLDSIIRFADCIFTPLLGHIKYDLSYTAKYADTPLESWNTPGSGFLARAWCRAEIFYACNIPNFSDNNERIVSFRSTLRHFAEIGKRPHFVYAFEGIDTPKNSLLLAPLLQNSLFKELDPEYGRCSNDEDITKIMELTSKLSRYVEKTKEGYFGQTKNKKMHGKGLLRFNSGAIYQGNFVQGKKHGNGTFVYASGNVYTGGWADDMKNGMGEFRFVNGNLFRGHMKADKKHGEGMFKWKSGQQYDGMWVDDHRHGKGKMTFSDGSEYRGVFFEDCIEGEGTMHYSNNEVYKGEFADGQRHGHGEMLFRNGDTYDGQFMNGAMQGLGVYTSKSGKYIYDGNFLQNERHGFGKCKYEDGEYVGSWQCGQRCGQGTFTNAANGDKYVGDWKDDMKHGNGIFKSNNGTYEGQYQFGKLHGKGKFIYLNGDEYEGVWLHDKKQGRGKYTYQDGRSWIAMWRDDELVEKIES